MRSHADADDLAQDVFVRTINSPELGQIAEPRAFLTTLAKCVLCNFWRRQELEQAYLQALQELPETLLPSAEELALINETIAQIDALLNGLSLKVRHAFLLNRLEGMTHVEIAASMSLSVATIERYIKQALLHCYQAANSGRLG